MIKFFEETSSLINFSSLSKWLSYRLFALISKTVLGRANSLLVKSSKKLILFSIVTVQNDPHIYLLQLDQYLCVKQLKLGEGDLFLFQYFIIFHSCGWIHFQFQDYTLCMPLVNLISLFTKKRITFRVWAICNHVIPNHVVQCAVNKFLFIVCC